jgi:hypothetical protein
MEAGLEHLARMAAQAKNDKDNRRIMPFGGMMDG